MTVRRSVLRRRSLAGVALALLFLALAGALSPRALAQEAAGTRPAVVGVAVAPPFVIRQADDTLTGIAVQLWREIAERLSLAYELDEVDLPTLLDEIAAGDFAVGVSAIAVTPKRERIVDFSHPYHTSGYGIAVQPQTGAMSWLSVAGRFFSIEFLQVVVTLALVLLVAGVLVWLFERRRNPEQFGGPPLRGIGNGFWWSAVTMTTVGYGDKAPSTLGGRIVALVWMFAAIIIISSFTAAIASSLTVSQLSPVKSVSDLAGVRTGTVAGSAAEEYLSGKNIGFRSYPSVEAGLEAVRDDQLDAFIYDAAILKYLATEAFDGMVSILPETFDRIDYALALPRDSDLREPINRALLEVILSADWQQTLQNFLGRGNQ